MKKCINIGLTALLLFGALFFATSSLFIHPSLAVTHEQVLPCEWVHHLSGKRVARPGWRCSATPGLSLQSVLNTLLFVCSIVITLIIINKSRLQHWSNALGVFGFGMWAWASLGSALILIFRFMKVSVGLFQLSTLIMPMISMVFCLALWCMFRTEISKLTKSDKLLF